METTKDTREIRGAISLMDLGVKRSWDVMVTEQSNGSGTEKLSERINYAKYAKHAKFP